MKSTKRLGIILVGLGIGWIWLISILWTFIDIDGWILYPIGSTSVFLLLCISLYFIYKIDDYYDCTSCSVWFDKQSNPPFIKSQSYDPDLYFCPECTKRLDLKNILSAKEKTLFNDRLDDLEFAEKKRLGKEKAELEQEVVEP